MKKRLITLVLVGMTLLGLGLSLYPLLADWWNSVHQSRAVTDYARAAEVLARPEQEALLTQAEAYNARLAETGVQWTLDDAQQAEYNAQLDITGTGIMGYLNIPRIGVTLPIYHGTSEEVLQVAVGHLAGTSLPVGGKGTHCSVSGHRGLPGARLFTDLEELAQGDTFTVTVLDRTLTYEVDQIRIVLPSELEELAIDPEQDYFTLITCTPYAVNTHRLLVRGRRTENAPGAVTVLAEAVLVDPRLAALVMAVPMLAVLFVGMMISTGRRIRAKETLARRKETGPDNDLGEGGDP